MQMMLLFRDKGPGPAAPGAGERFQDLKLKPILDAMSDGDPAVEKICRRILDDPLQTEEEILRRQEVLRECMEKPALIRRLYTLCREAEDRRKNTWNRLTSPHLTTVYASAADLLKIYMETLVAVRRSLQQEIFVSQGLRQLSETLSRELSEEYLDRVRALEDGIRDREGMLISASFGPYLQGVSYVKCRPRKGLSRLRWLLQPSYTLADQDMLGAKDLEARQDRAINEVANAMAQAAGSLQSFTDRLREQLAFCVGALNLRDRLRQLGAEVCFPEPVSRGRVWEGLYDGSLVLEQSGKAVGNSLEARGKALYLITGANQGGKTTFLRSVGQCQVMGQCGLFVCAKRCRFPVRRRILTHFCREEDRKMDSGKLDEELGRMSGIVDSMVPGGLLLSNESFSSTNDRDGSEIFCGVTRAFLETGVEVFAVTHLQGYARTMAERADVLSLVAERKENGERTFRMVPGMPADTAYGEELCGEL